MKNIEDYLPEVAVAPGSTSYFSAPDDHLDPALFEGETMRPDVRSWILNTLFGCWQQHFQHLFNWTRVWVAGSGASYQWAASREPGDLDVLIGVDYPKFRRSNPAYAGLSDAEISDALNDISRAELYPATAAAVVGGKVFEVTWYVNNNATDIRSIHPYAAYDVIRNTWTVHPQQALTAPHSPELDSLASHDKERAQTVLASYMAALEKVRSTTHPAQLTNARIWLAGTAADAKKLFDTIHLGRRSAFGPDGQGYADVANFRWQSGKAAGIVPALHGIAQGLDAYEKAREDDLYGETLDAPETLLRRALTYRINR